MVIPAGWKEVRLGEIAEIISGGTPSTAIGSYWGGDIPWCTPTDITSCKSNFLFETERKITPAGLAGSAASLLPPGSLLLCTRATVGDVRIAGRAIATNQGFKSLVVNSQANSKFVYFVLQTLRPAMIEKSSGSTFLELGKNDLSNIVALMPPLKQQEEIAEALSDADAAIESLDSLIAKKRDVTQAAMQRFARVELMESHAKMVSLGSIVEIRKGELITEATAQSGPYPVIAGGKEAAYYSSKYNREGLTITVSASGANAGYVALRNGPIWASDCSTISENPAVDLRFISAQMQVRQEKIYKSQFGGAQPHVRPNDLVALEICLVPVERQREIGQILNAMDDELEALTEQVSKLRMIKEGMMQDLLTGKVRLV